MVLSDSFLVLKIVAGALLANLGVLLAWSMAVGGVSSRKLDLP